MAGLERMVDRVVSDEAGASDLVAMAMMLYSLPQPVDRVDAIAVQPGMGEHRRVAEAVEAWNTSPIARNLFVTGVYNGEDTFVSHDINTLRQPPFNLRRDEGVETQVHAHHTVEQAEWLVEQVRDHGTTSMALYVSAYHLLRAYCTNIKTSIKKGRPRIPIVPKPVAVSPDGLVPEAKVNAWDLVDGEVRRIAVYQEKGDVATYGEFREYISWLWRQPLFTEGPVPFNHELASGVVAELKALRDNEFVPDPEIDTVWVFSGHDAKSEGDDPLVNQLNLDAGVETVRAITASRLDKPVGEITKEDIAEHGPTLFYNGSQSEEISGPDSPMPESKVVCADIDASDTATQMEGFGDHVREQTDPPRMVAVVSSFGHRPHISRYVGRYRYTFPEGTTFVNGPVPEDPEHLSSMGAVIREARAILQSYDTGHLALQSALT